MQINFTSRENPILRMGGSNQQHNERLAARTAAREREARLRETEDKLIAQIREEMDRVRASGMDSDTIASSLRALGAEIAEILKQRAEREQMAMELEMQQKRADMEERRREIEERAEERRAANATTNEEIDELRESSLTRSLARNAQRVDNISQKRRIQASLESEAAQLSRDLDNSYGPVVIHDMNELFAKASGSAGPIDPAVWMNNGHGNKDFRNRHLAALRTGTAALDAAIMSETAALYRDTMAQQESRARLSEEYPVIDEEL